MIPIYRFLSRQQKSLYQIDQTRLVLLFSRPKQDRSVKFQQMNVRRKSTKLGDLGPSSCSVSLLDITEKEKQLAQEVWVQVESNHVTISKQLFTELFTQHPDYKRFFKDLIHDDGTLSEDAWLTPEFERHMTQVLMPSLSRLVNSLDNLQQVEKQMIRLGRIHRDKAINLKRQHVETLKAVFVSVLKEFFGPRLSAVHEAALVKVFSAAFCVFEDQL